MANGPSYSYSYKEANEPYQFILTGISEDVARGIRAGLRRVTTITELTVERVVQTRETLTADPV